MNLESFSKLKRALKSGTFDETELKKIKLVVDPLLSEQIDYITRNVDERTTFDHSKFMFLENTQEYKNELVITYLLFVGKTLNIEKLRHTFITPFNNSIYNWMYMYKLITYSIITLLYGKKWSNQDLFLLDEMIIRLNEGKPEALRQFLSKIKVFDVKTPFEAETKYIYNRKLTSDQFGPFYWRLVHFMAEAYDLKKNSEFSKSIWRDFCIYSLHRTLRCIFCEEHYKVITAKYKTELRESSNYSKLWFKIHNEVNVLLNKKPYDEASFEKDKQIMISLL